MQPNYQTIAGQQLWKKRLLAIALLVIVVFVGWQLYYAQTFHIVKTNPALSHVAAASPFLKIDFNQQLVSQNLHITSSPKNIVASSNISGNTLTINLDGMVAGTNYTISLPTISSTSNKQMAAQVLRFTAKNIDVSDLPSDQQKAILNNQDNYQSPANDPIVSRLPHSTLDYTLTAVLNTGTNGKTQLVLDAQILLAASDTVNGDAAKQAAINQYEQEVVDYIKSLGLDPSKYTIQYEVIDSSN